MIVCDAEHLGFLDAVARRNAFGRQLQSFEADLEVAGSGDEPLRAVFIRAPWVESFGHGVEVLASYDGHPVAIREGSVLACAFHPELTDDPRFHAIFMAMTTAAAGRGPERRRSDERRRSTGPEPGEDPGRLLDRGEGGRRRLDRRRERGGAAARWRSTRRC